MAKHGFRVDGVGRRVCDVLGCWQHWPCGIHAPRSVGTLLERNNIPIGRRPSYLHTPLSQDPTCLGCGYAVCSCPPTPKGDYKGVLAAVRARMNAPQRSVDAPQALDEFDSPLDPRWYDPLRTRH